MSDRALKKLIDAPRTDWHTPPERWLYVKGKLLPLTGVESKVIIAALYHSLAHASQAYELARQRRSRRRFPSQGAFISVLSAFRNFFVYAEQSPSEPLTLIEWRRFHLDALKASDDKVEDWTTDWCAPAPRPLEQLLARKPEEAA